MQKYSARFKNTARFGLLIARDKENGLTNAEIINKYDITYAELKKISVNFEKKAYNIIKEK